MKERTQSEIYFSRHPMECQGIILQQTDLQMLEYLDR